MDVTQMITMTKEMLRAVGQISGGVTAQFVNDAVDVPVTLKHVAGYGYRLFNETGKMGNLDAAGYLDFVFVTKEVAENLEATHAHILAVLEEARLRENHRPTRWANGTYRTQGATGRR